MIEDNFQDMLRTYAEKDIFIEKQKEGYQEVDFGRGNWCDIGKLFDFTSPISPASSERIVACFVFYHPTGKIELCGTPKFHIPGRGGLSLQHQITHKKNFKNEKEFQDYTEFAEITMKDDKKNLRKIIESF
jgi:hypothetical protein